IPAYTRHYVTCLADQHTSPADALALRRILDARDALDPCAPWEVTASVVRVRGATAIALNGRLEDGPALDVWSPAPGWYDAARARLERAPQAFERLYQNDRFSVYAIHEPALSSLRDGGTAPPFVRAARPGEPGRALGPGLPELVSAGMSAPR